jgi:DNA-binding XRE family transcriptional regulator
MTGHEFRALRKAAGMTAGEWGALFLLKPQTIRNIECKAQVRPRLEMLVTRIAREMRLKPSGEPYEL